MLHLRDITKIYRAGAVETPVLRGVSFEVMKGEFIAIMGASGTGKTTLMNILGCLDVSIERHVPVGWHGRVPAR